MQNVGSVIRIYELHSIKMINSCLESDALTSDVVGKVMELWEHDAFNNASLITTTSIKGTYVISS